MKKKLLTLLTSVLCVIACAIAFVACGDNANSNTDETATNEVTEEQWQQAFSTASNFTLTPYVSETQEDGIGVDGNKIQMGTAVFFTKDAEKYYQYVNSGNGCIRMEITEESYSETAEGVLEIVTVWKDKKADFTYAEGTYTAASITLSEYTTATNVKIKFENGNLISIEYTTLQYDGEPVRNVVNNFGTMTVTLPTEFTVVG